MTFGRERYAPIPGETADGARAMQIQASFAWREIPRDRLTLGKILGEGEFGMVVKGELTEDDGHVTPCAVKKLKRMFIDLMLTSVAVALLFQWCVIIYSVPIVKAKLVKGTVISVNSISANFFDRNLVVRFSSITILVDRSDKRAATY